VNLEIALNEIVELARAHLHTVRTHAAHTVRRLHDEELGTDWRHESASV
jgi:hypothetical protein